LTPDKALPDGDVDRSAWKSPEGAWIGKVTIVDSLFKPDTELWEVLRQREGELF